MLRSYIVQHPPPLTETLAAIAASSLSLGSRKDPSSGYVETSSEGADVWKAVRLTYSRIHVGWRFFRPASAACAAMMREGGGFGFARVDDASKAVGFSAHN